MPSTVFWSWQSDREGRVTRQIIREALALALAEIQSHPDIEDRVELDHDTRDVPGMPDISASILEKIDAAAVFVGPDADSGRIIPCPHGSCCRRIVQRCMTRKSERTLQSLRRCTSSSK